MQKIFDYDQDYSEEYRSQFAAAVQEAKNLGFTRPPLVSEQDQISDEILRFTAEEINKLSVFLDALCRGYWGNYCQALSTHIFAYLNSISIPAEIVIGNVHINGTDEFDATLDKLKAEYLSELPLEGSQELHAWVSLGGDTIIDAALPPRLVKNYEAPSDLEDTIFIGRANYFSARYSIRYEPLLVGTEFLAKTNPPDPIEILAARLKK